MAAGDIDWHLILCFQMLKHGDCTSCFPTHQDEIFRGLLVSFRSLVQGMGCSNFFNPPKLYRLHQKYVISTCSKKRLTWLHVYTKVYFHKQNVLHTCTSHVPPACFTKCSLFDIGPDVGVSVCVWNNDYILYAASAKQCVLPIFCLYIMYCT